MDDLDEIRKKKLEERWRSMTEKKEPKKVVVYSTPSCPYCSMVKDYLRMNNVEFDDVDVSSDQARAQEMILKSGQMGVPVIDIGGRIIIGFDKPAIDMELDPVRRGAAASGGSKTGV